MDVKIVNFIDISKIKQEMMEGRFIKVASAETWANNYSWGEVRTLMHETATYVLPTSELLEFLRNQIDGKKAIEVGAGNGLIGRNLGITMTDSYQQRDDKETVAYYKAFRQPLIDYPADVLKMDAVSAARKYKPDVVIACYVTHRWEPGMESGNMHGVDFRRLLQYTDKLILVGNLMTHKDNPIMKLPHREVQLQGLITRSDLPWTNPIFIWNKKLDENP